MILALFDLIALKICPWGILIQFINYFGKNRKNKIHKKFHYKSRPTRWNNFFARFGMWHSLFPCGMKAYGSVMKVHHFPGRILFHVWDREPEKFIFRKSPILKSDVGITLLVSDGTSFHCNLVNWLSVYIRNLKSEACSKNISGRRDIIEMDEGLHSLQKDIDSEKTDFKCKHKFSSHKLWLSWKLSVQCTRKELQVIKTWFSGRSVELLIRQK